MKTVSLLLCLLWLTMPLMAGDVPDFTLDNLDGSVFKISDYMGKRVIIIDFWATWCKPCKKLLKKLQQIKDEFADDVYVVTISIDDASALSAVKTYVKGRRFDFMVLLDPDSTVAKMFNPCRKVPFTMMIDKQGKIVYTHSGYLPGDEKELIKKLKESL